MSLMKQHNRDEEMLEKIVSLMQRDESFDAPPDSIQWTKNLFRARATEPKKSLARRILAVLQMDLSPDQAAFGERSAAASAAARQMFFQAGANALDLRISTGDKIVNLQGQILGAGFNNGTLKIVGENISFETNINEIGEFAIAEIPIGKYDLIVQNGEMEIVVENLELG